MGQRLCGPGWWTFRISPLPVSIRQPNLRTLILQGFCYPRPPVHRFGKVSFLAWFPAAAFWQISLSPIWSLLVSRCDPSFLSKTLPPLLQVFHGVLYVCYLCPSAASSPGTEITTAVSNRWTFRCTGPSALKPGPASLLSHLTPMCPSGYGIGTPSSRTPPSFLPGQMEWGLFPV